MKFRLQDLIDINHFQNLQDKLNKIYSFPSSIIDNDGNILTATAWQDVCTKFHRKNKECEKRCIESDKYIQDHIHEANPAVSYRCPHGLVDNATPIIIDGIHYGNFFTGQFFMEEPDLDFFRAQAKKYGFHEDQYIEAVKKVPIWTKEQLDDYLFFIKGLIAVISESGLKRLKEIETRKKNEESEKRHQTILKAAMDGFWLCDSDGRLLEVNDSYSMMSGYHSCELLTMQIADLEIIEKSQDIAGHLKRVRQYGADRFETKHRRKDGSIFDVEVSVQYREGGDETFFVFIRDISDRKRAEEILSKSEFLFRGLFDNMTSGSAIYEVINDGSKGSDYIVKNFNKKSLEIEGKTLEQVVGKSLLDLRPNIDDYGLIPVMKKVWETGEPAYFPIKIYQDDIFSNYYENTIFKIPAGEVVTIYNDVTDQKNAEKALKESEERFALAMEFANDGLFDWNLETNKIYYSPVWKKMLGYEDDELPNDFSTWETLTEPEDAKRSWKMQNDLINKKRDKFEIEFKMRHKDGHWVDILSRANAIFDENKKAVRIIGTHVDISERKKLESQLLQSQKLESIGTLAGGIAHEFNNILSIIIGNNELIMEDLPEWSLSRENAEEIRLAGLRARDIVKHLLTFSRHDSSTKKPISIGEVVKESLKLIRTTIPTNIEIKEKISPDCLPVFGNSTQINQVLINLCNNAAAALPISGGKIDIELCNTVLKYGTGSPTKQLSPGKYLKLVILDNGSGMEKNTLDRIFEPYFTTKDVGEGSGIGLAVVHGIVENHGGSIVCESSLGIGTTFTILIPAHEGPVKKESEKQNMPLGKGEHILYVDDEPSIVKIGKCHLESLGYEVFSTTDPAEALELIKTEPDRFDLVISDMAMPKMPGDQLITEILAVNPEIPTIICTGYSSRISETNVSEIGVKAFLMKPLNKSELAEKVRKVLDKAKPKNQD